MNLTEMHVRMRTAEGALLRLIGLIGRCGFDVVNAESRRCACGHTTNVMVQISGSRSAQLLTRQIMKLYDVQEVVLEDTHAEVGGAVETRVERMTLCRARVA